jgi:hypothetical protein
MVTLPLAAVLALLLFLGMKWAGWAKGVVFLAVLFGLAFGSTDMGRQVEDAMSEASASLFTQVGQMFSNGGGGGRTAR